MSLSTSPSSAGTAGPIPDLDPVLFEVLTSAVEEEAALSYAEGFRDGLLAARFRPHVEDDAAPSERVVAP